MTMRQPTAKKVLACILLIALTWAVYRGVYTHEFIYFDDQLYVTDNRHVKQGLTRESLIWAFTNTEVGHWHPLTWVSHLLDYELYRLNPAGHYGTNLILHLLNVFLLLTILARITGCFWRSFFVAALFALHPLNVESVAWIAERKNVLSTSFWFLTLGAYWRFVRKRNIISYMLTMIIFVMGLLTKPMLVTLPFVLLLLDVWPLRRLESRRDIVQAVIEKIPLFIFSMISVSITIAAARSVGTIAGLDAVSLPARLQNVLLSYAAYMWKMIYHFDLAVFYPFPSDFSPLSVTTAGLLILLLSMFAWRTWRSYPFFMVGWCWYVGTMLPVIGLIQVGKQALADRYTYVPMIGLFIVAAWGVPVIYQKVVQSLADNREAWILPLTASLLLLLSLSLITERQVRIWESNVTLFKHALAVTSKNQKAHHGLGLAYNARGEHEQAVYHLLAAIKIRPEESTYNDLGYIFMAGKKYPEAEEQFRAALNCHQRSAKVHNNLGAALAVQGRIDEAINHFHEALKIDPTFESARHNLKMANKGQ